MMVDARTHAEHSPGVPPERGAEWVPRRFWMAPVPYQSDLPTAGEPIMVFANQGRWLVSCPDCGSASHACLTDLRYMCSECANEENGGAYRPTVLPEDMEAIEAALVVRPRRARNWKHPETLELLLAENTAHGVG